MRYNEIIESMDDDDDLFGRGLHHRIAAALLAQAEEDQRIADEERGLGDQIHRNVQNAEEFEEQARNYRYIADAFNQSMAQGVKVYRSLDRSWRQAVDDVVDIDLDMDFREYEKQIPESTDDSNTNNVIAQKIFFARSNKTPKGWSYDHVGFITQSGKQIQMSGHKGNDVYVTNAVTDDPEFSKQNITVMPLSKPVTVPTTNSVGAENCGTFVANVLKANGVKDFDLQKIYSTFKTPPQSDMVESEDDDLFSTSPKLDRRQELKAKAIRRIEKRDALNIQPGTRLMVKWDNGKYYKGKVVRLTPSGRVIAQVKFHNVGWPLEKNISPRDIKPEHILKETDDDMFAKHSQMSQDIKTKLKQIDDPYLRTVRKIRELAKTKYGAKIRVSGAPKTSARGRATVWVGDYDANYQIPKTTPAAFRVKEDLEQMGFECRFTDAGWLSVKVPPVFSDLISEESDDDLFGKEDGARQALKLLKLLRAAVQRDPRGVGEMLKQYSNENSTMAQRVGYTLDYMAQAVGMPREIFDQYADDFFILPWPTGVDINRPWQIWDAQVLDKTIETMRRVVYGQDMNESDNDDDLFSHSVHEEVIYRVEEYKKGLEKHLEVVQQADPEDAEYLEDVINDLNQVLVKLQKNWIEGMDALIQASDSEDWAENIMHELKADNIPVSKYYRAPWLRENSVNKYTEDIGDDELFGSGYSAVQRQIYETGRQMLQALKDSWKQDSVRSEFQTYMDADDGDAMFDLVQDVTRVHGWPALVVDTVIREYTATEGLNDFGWMLEEGSFNDLEEAWERFRTDREIKNEPWFQVEADRFMKRKLR